MNSPISYTAALRWLVDNDDCEWLDDEDSSLSVTAALVADIYQVQAPCVREDLTHLKNEGNL